MRIHIKIFFAFILILVGWVGLRAIMRISRITLSGQNHSSACITVFVHGSIFSPLSLLSPSQVIEDNLSDDSWYVSLLKNIRLHPLLQEDQILLQEGWQPIASDVLDRFNTGNFSDGDKKLAAHFIVPAYDSCAKKCLDSRENFYYAFGHLGLLSQRYRKDAAGQMYEHLCGAITELKQTYDTVKVVIVTHSHGGNIALNLADEEQKQQRGIVVDDLIMFGTPLQVETAYFAYDPIFKRVINCYSDSDVIQIADSLSTRARKSYRTFSDPGLGIPPAGDYRVYDVRLLVNKKTNVIDHANMWLLGKSKKICGILYPFPAVVLAPLLLPMLDVCMSDKAFDYNIIEKNGLLKVALHSYKKNSALVTSPNMCAQVQQLVARVKEGWDPEDKSQSVLFNKKGYVTLYDAWKAFKNGKKQVV